MFTGLLLGVGARGAVNDLKSDLGLAASNYLSQDNGTGPLAAFILLTIKRDGTWTITGGGDDILSGTPLSGTWVNTPYVNVGDNYQVQFVDANETNTLRVTNGAIGFTTINGDITYQLDASAGESQAVDLTVNLRQVGSSVTQLTDTTTLFGAVGG